MLELAHKLADSDSKFFGGWVLAGVEAHIHGQAAELVNKTLLAKERKCIIQVLGTAGTAKVDHADTRDEACAKALADASHAVVKELKVFLVLPKRQLGSKVSTAEPPQGSLILEHVFTVQEVRDYVAYTGDENIIHQGEHPIVPGLCMAAWLQQALQLTELDWRISFLSPVYTGDELQIYDAGDELQAYVGSSKVFNIKL